MSLEMLICIKASRTYVRRGLVVLKECRFGATKTCQELRQHGWPVEGKSGRARSWGYGNPGKTPGAGGRLNRSSFPFMSSLWGSSCICCSWGGKKRHKKEPAYKKWEEWTTAHFQQHNEKHLFPTKRESDQSTEAWTMAAVLASHVVTCM